MNVATLHTLVHYYYHVTQLQQDSETRRDSHNYLVQRNLLAYETLVDPNDLRDAELVVPCKNTIYKITEKGRIHVKALAKAPLPVQGWHSPIQQG